jgi:hypothetical protein
MAGLIGGKQKMPAIEAPTPMPDETQTVAARKRRIVKETAQSGAQSTILSAGSREKLGG